MAYIIYNGKTYNYDRDHELDLNIVKLLPIEWQKQYADYIDGEKDSWFMNPKWRFIAEASNTAEKGELPQSTVQKVRLDTTNTGNGFLYNNATYNEFQGKQNMLDAQKTANNVAKIIAVPAAGIGAAYLLAPLAADITSTAAYTTKPMLMKATGDFGLSMLGGETVNSASKALTGKTWGLNLSGRDSGWSTTFSDLTNPGYFISGPAGILANRLGTFNYKALSNNIIDRIHNFRYDALAKGIETLDQHRKLVRPIAKLAEVSPSVKRFIKAWGQYDNTNDIMVEALKDRRYVPIMSRHLMRNYLTDARKRVYDYVAPKVTDLNQTAIQAQTQDDIVQNAPSIDYFNKKLADLTQALDYVNGKIPATDLSDGARFYKYESPDFLIHKKSDVENFILLLHSPEPVKLSIPHLNISTHIGITDYLGRYNTSTQTIKIKPFYPGTGRTVLSDLKGARKHDLTWVAGHEYDHHVQLSIPRLTATAKDFDPLGNAYYFINTDNKKLMNDFPELEHASHNLNRYSGEWEYSPHEWRSEMIGYMTAHDLPADMTKWSPRAVQDYNSFMRNRFPLVQKELPHLDLLYIGDKPNTIGDLTYKMFKAGYKQGGKVNKT